MGLQQLCSFLPRSLAQGSKRDKQGSGRAATVPPPRKSLVGHKNHCTNYSFEEVSLGKI